MLLAAVSVLLALSLVLTHPQAALAAPLSNADTATWTTDGYVNTIVCRGDITYIGGSFTGIGPKCAGGVSMDAATADYRLRPGFDGTLKAAVDDGSGGWFVGGDFTQVLGVARNRLAHIRADGTLDPDWNPGATATVNALALSADGNTLFVGGAFSGAGSIGGTDRNYLAKLDSHGTGTGDPTWNPNPWDQVLCMALSPDGSSLYIGGLFLRVGIGWVRNRIAKVETGGTGARDATWNPNANHWVDTMCLSADGNSLFVGGIFSDASGTPTIGGQTRNYIAKLDAHNAGAADPNWDPNARPFGQAYVYSVSLTPDGNYLFASGQFQTIGGQSRFGVAKLEAGNTGQADATWNTGCDGFPRAVAVSPDEASLYVGGDYTHIGGQLRNRIAKVNTSGTGAALPWRPSADGEVDMIAASPDGSSVFIGGLFTSIRLPRSNLAAIDNVTGEATEWQPNPNGEVLALALSADGNSIYVGGDFNGTGSIGGLDRNRLAKVSTSGAGSVDSSWDPNANYWVRSLAISADGNSLFAGGDFSTLGGLARNCIAKLDAGGTGAADATWDLSANAGVYSLLLSQDGTSVFAGGDFGTWNGSPTIGGRDRNCIAKLDAGGTGAADASWNPDANSTVYSMSLTVDGNSLFAGGAFATWNGSPTIGGQDRNCIAKLDAGGTGAADANWDPNANFFVQCVRVSPDGGSVIAAGDFCTDQGSPTIGGQDLNYMAKLDATGTGQADPTWNVNPHGWPPASGKAAAFSPQGDSLFVGGAFADIGGLNTSFARFCYQPTVTSVTPSQALNDAPVNITDITGTGFRSTSTLLLRQAGQPDIPGTGVTVTSSQHMSCTFDITGAVGGHRDVVVVNPDTQEGLLAGGFLITPPTPTLAAITPSSGTRGTTVSITDLAGTNFDGTPVVKLKKAGKPDIDANGVTRASATKLTCEIPLPADAAAGAWDVFVQNPDGQNAILPGGFTVEEAPLPPSSGAWYLAEGTNAWGFSTYITIENPNASPCRARLTYMDPSPPAAGKGVITSRTCTLPARSQTTISSSEIIGEVDFSTKVESLDGKPLAVDRTMFWAPQDPSVRGYHSSIGTDTPAKTWYLPEGSSAWGFETWTAVLNPNPTEANVTLTYMTASGPLIRNKAIPANSRATWNMASDIGAADASIEISSDQPVVAERSMYNKNRREGSCSIGASAPANDFYLSEGAVGYEAGFTTWVLVQNPGDTANEVSLTFQTGTGPVAGPTFTMPANTRRTIKLNDYLPADTDVSTRVHGTKPLVAERAMYWDAGLGECFHASIGLSESHMTFMCPDGQSDSNARTYTLVQNPNPASVTVRITYLPQDGGNTISFTAEIPKESRATFDMADKISSGRAAIMVESLDGARPIMVERAMYGADWGSGTDTIGAFSD